MKLELATRWLADLRDEHPQGTQLKVEVSPDGDLGLLLYTSENVKVGSRSDLYVGGGYIERLNWDIDVDSFLFGQEKGSCVDVDSLESRLGLLVWQKFFKPIWAEVLFFRSILLQVCSDQYCQYSCISDMVDKISDTRPIPPTYYDRISDAMDKALFYMDQCMDPLYESEIPYRIFAHYLDTYYYVSEREMLGFR